jgi:ribosome maturation factor RimP
VTSAVEIREEIKNIAEGKLTDPGHFVVDVVVSLRSKQKVLVIVDGDHGVTIGDCAELSRAMSDALDNLRGLNESYVLEVSTPGVDHPLKFGRQYGKHVGRKLKVTLRDKTVEGKLLTVSPDSITLEQETGSGRKREVQTIDIQFSEIDKSFVLVSFK